jgi:hypothetical protein
MKKIAKGQAGSVMAREGNPPSIERIEHGEQDLSWKHNAISVLEQIGGRPRKPDPHFLDDGFANYPYFEVVFELDDEGVQRYPNWINPEMYGRIKAGGKGTDRTHQAYFRSVTNTRKPYLSPIYLSSATEDFCLTVAVPVPATQNAASGILVADINIASLVRWTMSQDADSK